jgi:hypothetical protein
MIKHEKNSGVDVTPAAGIFPGCGNHNRQSRMGA